VLVHEQTTAHHCPVQIERRRVRDTPDTPVPLLTTFLSSDAGRPLDPDTKRPTPTLRHALKLRLISLRQTNHGLVFGDHLEQIEDWQDVLVVDIAPAVDGAMPRAWAVWNSALPGAVRDWKPTGSAPLPDQDPDRADHWLGSVALPTGAHDLLSTDARLQLTVTPR